MTPQSDCHALLEIEDLHVEFPTQGSVMHAVDGVSLTLEEGEVLGIVGESGSGKSVAMMALMGLIAYPGRVRAKTLRFAGNDLLGISDKERRRAGRQGHGDDLPGADHQPEPLLHHRLPAGRGAAAAFAAGPRTAPGAAPSSCWSRSASRPRTRRLNDYPHQMSGGMNQRVMIAMAISCNPRLLIADEPTTALDVTIQAQILDLLRNLQQERGMALVLITHNMGVVSEMAQRVAVMYAGQVMEQRPVAQLFADPQHPYTEALLAALPERGAGRPPAGDHSRRGARRVRPAERLPVRAALRLRHRALDGGAARAAALAGRAGALPLPAGRSAAARQRSSATRRCRSRSHA